MLGFDSHLPNASCSCRTTASPPASHAGNRGFDSPHEHHLPCSRRPTARILGLHPRDVGSTPTASTTSLSCRLRVGRKALNLATVVRIHAGDPSVWFAQWPSTWLKPNVGLTGSTELAGVRAARTARRCCPIPYGMPCSGSIPNLLTSWSSSSTGRAPVRKAGRRGSSPRVTTTHWQVPRMVRDPAVNRAVAIPCGFESHPASHQTRARPQDERQAQRSVIGRID